MVEETLFEKPAVCEYFCTRIDKHEATVSRPVKSFQ